MQKRVQKDGKLHKGEVQKVRIGRCQRMIKGVMEEQKWGLRMTAEREDNREMGVQKKGMMKEG